MDGSQYHFFDTGGFHKDILPHCKHPLGSNEQLNLLLRMGNMKSAGDLDYPQLTLRGGPLSRVGPALQRCRSAMERSSDGDALGGQKREVCLEATKGLSHERPCGLTGGPPTERTEPTRSLDRLASARILRPAQPQFPADRYSSADARNKRTKTVTMETDEFYRCPDP